MSGVIVITHKKCMVFKDNNSLVSFLRLAEELGFLREVVILRFHYRIDKLTVEKINGKDALEEYEAIGTDFTIT